MEEGWQFIVNLLQLSGGQATLSLDFAAQSQTFKASTDAKKEAQAAELLLEVDEGKPTDAEKKAKKGKLDEDEIAKMKALADARKAAEIRQRWRRRAS